MSRLPESTGTKGGWASSQGEGQAPLTAPADLSLGAEKPGATGSINKSGKGPSNTSLHSPQHTPEVPGRCFSLEELQNFQCLGPTVRSPIWSVWGPPEHAASNVQAG